VLSPSSQCRARTVAAHAANDERRRHARKDQDVGRPCCHRALGVGTVGVTAASSGQATSASSGASRLDDGKDLLPKSNITEEQAIRAAQTAASGDLNEVDLEHAGRLVWNVDVGAKDVQVDAQTGDVAGASTDD
jgi:uncharacterized membrane protein YkoI